MTVTWTNDPEPEQRHELVKPDTVQTIDLDCPPGPTRPRDLIRGVLDGTGLEPINPDVTPFFGWAEYAFRCPRDRWEREIQPVIRPRIEALYHAGVIRYGSW